MNTPLSHRDLDVYKRAMAALIRVIAVTDHFPQPEKYELVAQMRAASRSVCSCLAEAWRKRKYPAAFVSKITDAESEAAETQTWADVALAHEYITAEESHAIIAQYEQIIAQLVRLRQGARHTR